MDRIIIIIDVGGKTVYVKHLIVYVLALYHMIIRH